jgi:hypothetical protein
MKIVGRSVLITLVSFSEKWVAFDGGVYNPEFHVGFRLDHPFRAM